MTCSVILSTYNSPAWLEKVLWGYLEQDEDRFELVIADDGSGEATRELIDRFRAEFGDRLIHVWHPDDGFRKCEILNKAIVASSSDYLIFSDGDCVPRRDFVSTHMRLREKGRFLSGGYLKLPMDLSVALTRDDIGKGRAFGVSWLWRNGLRPSRHDFKLAGGRLGLAGPMNAITTTRPTWNGHNASGWRTDILGANGFDERMAYGGQDCEFGERLSHGGVRPKQIRYSAICVHLDHSRGYVSKPDIKRNRRIRRDTRETRATTTDHGIEKRAGQDRA